MATYFAATGSEVLVNTKTQGSQMWPSIAPLSGGGYVVAWNDGQDKGKFQIFNNASMKVGVEQSFGVYPYAVGVTPLSGGGFMAFWADSGKAKTQRYASNGSKIGSEIVFSDWLGYQGYFVKSVELSNGNIIATWMSNADTTGDGDSYSINAQIVDRNGVKIGQEFVVNTNTKSEQLFQSISALSNGNFAVTWTDRSGTLGDTSSSIKAQIFSVTGTKIGSEFLVNTKTDNIQDNSIITALDNGGFVVAWQDYRGNIGSTTNTRFQIFDKNGSKIGSEVFVSDSGQFKAITKTPDGGFLIAYVKDTDARAQAYNNLGAKIGSEFDPNPASSGYVSGISLATLNGGNLIFGWDDYNQRADDREPSAIVTQTLSQNQSGDLSITGLISGNALEGSEIVASLTDADGIAGTPNYRFSSGSTILQEGSQRTYTPSNKAAGSTISVTATYLDGKGVQSTATASAGTVQDKDFSGALLLDGSASLPRVGAPISVSVQDPDGVPQGGITYSYSINGTVVQAGSEKSYTPLNRDIGGSIVASADYTDLQGHKTKVQNVLGNISTTASTGKYIFNYAFANAKFDIDAGRVIISSPGGAPADIGDYKSLSFADGAINRSESSGLIDNLYYFYRNKDVWHAKVDPAVHYNSSGWKEGRDPSPLFSTNGYLAANSDVARAGINPLDHYLNNGWREGRDPSAAFDNELYLARNPDVKAAGIDPLGHYLANGQAEGRQAYAAIGRASDLAVHPGFDTEFYLLSNPDVAAVALLTGDSSAFAYDHYKTFGWKEGRNPNAVFDTKGYLDAYGDVKAAGIDPLMHYDQFGWKEGRDPSKGFDTTAYLAAYGDVAQAKIDPMQHYLQSGAYEGRNAFSDTTFRHGNVG